CKTPGCEAGVCVTAHSNVTDSAQCTDTDNNACTTAGCEAGSCVLTHVTCIQVRIPCCGHRACHDQIKACIAAGGTRGRFAKTVIGECKAGTCHCSKAAASCPAPDGVCSPSGAFLDLAQ